MGDASADPASQLGPGHFYLGWACVSCLEWTVHLLVFCAYLRLVLSSSTLILKTLKDIWILWGNWCPCFRLMVTPVFPQLYRRLLWCNPCNFLMVMHTLQQSPFSFLLFQQRWTRIRTQSVILYGKVCVSSGLTFTLTLKDKIRQIFWPLE